MRSNLRTLAIASAAVTIAGAFLPAVRVPIFGTQSLYEFWQAPALAVVIFGALALGCAAMRIARPLPILGIGALFFIVRAGLRVRSGAGGGGGERGAIGEFMTGLGAAVELTWGYWVLVVGATLLVVAGVLLQQRRDDTADA